MPKHERGVDMGLVRHSSVVILLRELVDCKKFIRLVEVLKERLCTRIERCTIEE